MKKHISNTTLTTRSKARRYMAVWTALVLSLCLFTVPASAAGGDPLDIVNNLSDFISVSYTHLTLPTTSRV